MPSQTAYFKSFSPNFIRYLRSLTPEKWLFIFAIVLIFCTVFAAHQIFTINQHVIPSPGHAYTLTKKDFGKTITVKKGDTIILNLSLSRGPEYSITAEPEILQKDYSQAPAIFILHTGAVGKTIVAVTSRPKCLPGQLCPALVILNFKFQLAITP